MLGIFPEAGNWETVLRPARPGAAFLAARTGARILPIGFAGLLDVFPRPRHAAHRAALRSLRARGRRRARRQQVDEIGHETMRHIAALISPERRGHYSDDPAIRAAAQATEAYPWDEAPEG